jgi:hypothetical protein
VAVVCFIPDLLLLLNNVAFQRIRLISSGDEHV